MHMPRNGMGEVKARQAPRVDKRSLSLVRAVIWFKGDHVEKFRCKASRNSASIKCRHSVIRSMLHNKKTKCDNRVVIAGAEAQCREHPQ